MPELKKRVKERTGYEVEFTEGFAGAMVKPTEVLAGVQSGIIDIGVFCVCHEGQKLLLHNFPYYLPFGPDNPGGIGQRARRLRYPPRTKSDIGENIRPTIAELSIPFEPYNIISRVPIHGPAHAKGRRSAARARMCSGWKMSAACRSSITGPEVYTGFQSGLMDGNVVFMSIMDTLQLYDVAPYLIDIGFGSMSTAVIHMNARRLDRLPQEVKDIVLEVSRDTEMFAGKYTQEVIDKYEDIIKEEGRQDHQGGRG